MLFLFPSDYFNLKQVEADYDVEYKVVSKIPEFKTLLWNYDAFTQNETIKLYPRDFYTGDCVYRGWMLQPEEYTQLYQYLKQSGINLINTPEEYVNCHLFPNVYTDFGDYTPKSLIFEGVVDWDLVNKTFKRFMVKDYVKSVKGYDFPLYFETPVDAGTMEGYLEKFREYRGRLFTGGFVFKEFIELKKYGGVTNEYRVFYFKGRVLSVSRNSNQPESCPRPPKSFVDKWVSLASNFYTVDFAEIEDGTWVVLEVGDGQVSGLSPGQWPFKFYDDLRLLLT